MSLPQTETQNPKAELEAVVEAIRSHDRFLVTTHENPDGDALGSILAMKLALEQLGKDAFLYLSGIISLPSEYASVRSAGSCPPTPTSASSWPSTARTSAGSAPTRRSWSARPSWSTSTTTTTTPASARST